MKPKKISWDKSIQAELEAEAISLGYRYGCRAQVGCAVNSVGRVTWTASIFPIADNFESPSLAAAIARATYGRKTAAQKAKHLRTEAAENIKRAEQLERKVTHDPRP